MSSAEPSTMFTIRNGLRVALVLGLAWFYVAGASQHAREVNTSIGRGDQLGYVWDAQVVYGNWHHWTPPMRRGDGREYPSPAEGISAGEAGRPFPMLIGQRMRMPVYAAFLALAYRPTMTELQFFEVAKIWNIWLSLVLLGLVAIACFSYLPPLAATNMVLVVAFGYAIFRAGYAQPDFLFYVLFFATFLACWNLLRGKAGLHSLVWGVLAGALGGLAYLTKAVVPPFIALFLAVYGTNEIVLLARSRRAGTAERLAARRRFAWRLISGLAVGACFLAVVSPYILTSKRVFGQYFFNANTTYYMWYDDGGEARGIIWPHTDPAGRIAISPGRLMNAGKYWRTHTLGQIGGRVVDGLIDTAVRSYRTFWYLKFVVLYVGFALLLAVAGWRHTVAAMRHHAALVTFLSLYAAVYLVGTGFFVATSGTGGTRFILAHVAPLLFVASHVISSSRLRSVPLALGGVSLTPTHFHAFVLGTMGCDIVFVLWPRLMTTYGGF